MRCPSRRARPKALPTVPRAIITAAQKPDGFGRLQSEDALRPAHSIVDAIASGLDDSRMGA